MKLTAVNISKADDCSRCYSSFSNATCIFGHPSYIQGMCVWPGLDDASCKVSTSLTVRKPVTVFHAVAYLTPLLVLSGSERSRIQPTSCQPAMNETKLSFCSTAFRKGKQDIPPNAPCSPRSPVRSECQIFKTEVMQVKMYGGAVSALATNYPDISAVKNYSIRFCD